MKKRSIVIALLVAVLLGLSITGVALARTVYWSGGDKITLAFGASTVTATWPATETGVYTYVVTLINPNGSSGVVQSNLNLSATLNPNVSGRYTVVVQAYSNSTTVVDKLKKSFRWPAN